MTVTLISPTAVMDAAQDCLFRESELTDGNPPPSAILVEGIVNSYAFHPDRLEAYRSDVIDWLSLLPHGFRQEVGGGWSFLMACDQSDGTQWTGEHRVMEVLFCLGIGLGLAHWQLPRELWPALPGSMPYVSITLTQEESP